ncbi:alpha-ketoacid dehydrogenase subunit beta [Chloroflexota bacterium]
MRTLTFSQAIGEALIEEMHHDSNVVLIGEDIGGWGGLGGAAKGLLEKFGSDRIIDTPISESLIAGGAIGAGIAGLRAICEIGRGEFLASVVDALVNNAARVSYVTSGKMRAPIVVRSAFGTNGDRLHPHSCEALFLNSPGLKVIMPSTPYDVKGMLKSAIRDDSPVICLEHQYLYDNCKGEVPENEYFIPIGSADIKRHGRDVTVVAIGNMVYQALAAAGDMSVEGIEAEIVDLCSLAPLDKETIFTSVSKTGRLVIAHEASKTGGFGAEVCALVSEQRGIVLKAPISRVAGMDVPLPLSYPLQMMVLPGKQSIIEAIKGIMN